MESAVNDAPNGGFALIHRNPYLLGVASVSPPLPRGLCVFLSLSLSLLRVPHTLHNDGRPLIIPRSHAVLDPGWSALRLRPGRRIGRDHDGVIRGALS